MLATVLCLIFFDCTALVVFVMAVASVCMVVSMIFRFRLADTIIAVCIGIVLSCLLLLNAQYRHDKAVSLCGAGSRVEAVITESPEFSAETGRYYGVASLKSINSQKASGKIRFSLVHISDGTDPSEMKPGDEVSFTAYVYPVGTDSSEIHNSFKSKNIFLGAYSLRDIAVKTPYLRPLTYYAEFVKEKIASTLSYYFSDSASGMLIAILTGDKSYCADEVYLNFKRSGAAHIMAVSGMHLSAWVTCLLFLAGKTQEHRRRLICFLGFPIIVFFLFVAEFSPSVCRAAIMTGLFLIGRLINAQTDTLNSLGFALGCILCSNPYAVYSVSFQLSFACVFAIATVALPLCEKANYLVGKHLRGDRLKRAIFCILSYVLVSISISAFTFPLSAYHFGYVSVASPLTNLLLVPLCAPVMILSLTFVFLHSVPYLSWLIFVCTDILSGYMLLVTERIGSSALATVCTDGAQIQLWIGIILVCGVIFLLRRLDKRYLFKATATVLLFTVAFLSLHAVERSLGVAKIRVITTENDSACLIIYNRKGVLIGTDADYGFTEDLERVLEAENVSLCAVLAEEDCEENTLEYLASDFGVDCVLYAGDTAELADGVLLKNRCDCAELNVKGKTIIIFYSDYLQDGKGCDIIIRNNGTVISKDGKTYYAHNKGHNTTVYINDSDSIKVRRENPWLSLTKKS